VAVVQYTFTHTHNIQDDTKQTIYRTTQKVWEIAGRAPSLHMFYERHFYSKNVCENGADCFTGFTAL